MKKIIFALIYSCGLIYAVEKPNVLLILSDDLNTSLSGFGHPQCKTPELDKLAKRGVIFNNMHCQYPVCGSSRASIMSGMYPYTNKTLGNVGSLRTSLPDVVTLSQIFKQNGYQTARVSKIYHMGIPNDILEGTAGKDDPLSWHETVNIKAPEHHAEGESHFWSPGDKGSQTFQSVATTGGDLTQADGMAAEEAIKLLDKYQDKPFFLAVGFVRPHVPLVAPKKYFDLYKGMEMQVPQVPENDLDDVPGIIRDYKSKDRYKTTPELMQGLLRSYYASVSYMDAQVGRVLDHLQKLDLDEKTIVIFSSDHGYLLGHHNKFQKQHLFEESTRVPFILSVPWLKNQHGLKTEKITELIDLYPTLTDLAGINTPEGVQGSSLQSLLKKVDSKLWTKELAFTISRNGGESIRTEKFRFTHWGFGSKGYELYDLSKDPKEFTNQAKNPEYENHLKNLKDRLIKKRVSAGFNDSFTVSKKKRKH